jgi:regulator of sigma E protease
MNVLLAFVVFTGSAATYGRPYVPTVVDSVIAGRPAALAGLVKGDSIVAVDGTPVRTWTDVVARVSTGHRSVGRPRRGARRRAAAHRRAPARRGRAGPDHRGQAHGRPHRRGADQPARPRPARPAERGGRGRRRTWESGTSVITVVRGLFTRDVSVSNLGGPIAIARTSVEAARLGFETLLQLIAFLSINIAVLNLLPIPVLDGGQVLINVLEALKGRSFSVRTREYILRAGLAAIGLLFVTVMWNDITRWFQDAAR